jgi:hypothetical protein
VVWVALATPIESLRWVKRGSLNYVMTLRFGGPLVDVVKTRTGDYNSVFLLSPVSVHIAVRDKVNARSEIATRAG